MPASRETARENGQRGIRGADAARPPTQTAFALLDSRLRFVEIDNAFARMHGIAAKESLGKTLKEVAPGSARSVEPALRKAIRTGRPVLDIKITFKNPSQHRDQERFNIFCVPGRDRNTVWLIVVKTVLGPAGQPTAILEAKADRPADESAPGAARKLQFLESASEAIVGTGLDLTVHFWNSGAERLYGWKKAEALGKNVRLLLRTKFSDPPADLMAELFRAGLWEGEGTQVRKDGERIPVIARFSLQRDENGTPTSVLAIYSDPSHRKRADQKLRQAEQQLCAFVKAINEYAIYMLDAEGHIISWNSGAERIKGYTTEDIVGRHFSCLYTSEDRDLRKPEMALAMAAARGTFQGEGWRLRKDGTRFWADVTLSALRDEGELRGFAEVTRDATDHRRMGEARQRLSERLLKLQDQERRDLARELRDGIAQHLTALATYLAVAERSGAPLGRRTRKALAECRSLADKCHHDVRAFSYLLHPPVLDEIGLPDALRWYCEGFTKRSGIAVDIIISSAVGRLAPEIEGAVFRIVQESLANIHRHSGSQDARIRIDQHEGTLILEVQDAGHGLPTALLPDGRINPARLGVGIAGMQERIRQLQGRLDIQSNERGTTVRTIIPISEGAA